MAPWVTILNVLLLVSHCIHGHEQQQTHNHWSSRGSNCFCQLEGQIDDCPCSVDTVDHFNNNHLFPRLSALLRRPYFRYFRYNPRRTCPFWEEGADSDGRCGSSSCAVRPCGPGEVPPGLDEDKENQVLKLCKEDVGESANVDAFISESARMELEVWQRVGRGADAFCELDAEDCPDECDYVDLTLNPERHTGYGGEAARKIWRAVYHENCFWSEREDGGGRGTRQLLLQSALFNELCLEKRSFFRAVSGLHASITVHLCANYKTSPRGSSSALPSFIPDEYGPNNDEFHRRFDPLATKGQASHWLKNLYFVYLLELRALAKASNLLERQAYMGSGDDDDDVKDVVSREVREVLGIVRSFPGQFDEDALFLNDRDKHSGKGKDSLKEEFRLHFLNVSRIMDCVTCDKCKLWGKLQITGLGTALKILSYDSGERKEDNNGRRGKRETDHGLRLSRNEVVALFNSFGRISTSIMELQKFRTTTQ